MVILSVYLINIAQLVLMCQMDLLLINSQVYAGEIRDFEILGNLLIFHGGCTWLIYVYVENSKLKDSQKVEYI